MKNLFSLLLCCVFSSAFATNNTFKQLNQVNKCWSEQKDVHSASLPVYGAMSERDWIRTHLSLVENTLRSRATESLSPSQKQNRAHCLDLLHGYWQAGNFPINEDYTYRTPIFIDKHDNFCAVGYLIKATGHEDVSRMIAATTNLAYVREMHYPQVNEWAIDNGFTVDELAWIQPGYPPASYCGKIGNGVAGSVQELFTDTTAGIMYVGGSFSQIDGTIAASNIAYVTESGGTYTWHAMGAGVNGPVNAIAKFDDKIFVAGSFTMAGGLPADNIAWWDATGWHSAGCVNGVVNDLLVYQDHLYAAGDFTDCVLTGESFAKWTGTAWQAIPGLTGRINTMEVKGTSMVLGGDFNYGATAATAAWWNEVSGFSLFANAISNEVMDFEIFEDTLYAVCKRTHATDTLNLLVKLRSNTWHPAFQLPEGMANFYPLYGNMPFSFNTLCAEPGYLYIGGQFAYAPMIGSIGRNCYSIGDKDNWVAVDSVVNKMAFFKGDLIIAGRFKNGNGSGLGGDIAVNGITRRVSPPTSAPSVSVQDKVVRVYPNPARAGAAIAIENNFSAVKYTLRDVTGREVSGGILDKASRITLPQIARGMYFITFNSAAGDNVIQKIMIE